MTIGRQVRAGRGLLRWSSVTLAEKAGLTRETINKIEDDAVQPREGTLQDIIRVFDENGVEFIENSGVRLKPQGVQVLTGVEGFLQFYDILYADLITNQSTVGVCNVDERLFSKYKGDKQDMHIARMAEFSKARNETIMKILICEGDRFFTATKYAEYRWIKKEYFSSTSFYVFSKYLALINFTAVPAPHVILIQSAAFAESYRQQFQKLWETAMIIPQENT